MRRFALLAAVATVATGLALVPAAGADNDNKGPRCTNIASGDGGFTTTSTGAIAFDFSMTLEAPACPKITYTFYVSKDGGAFEAIVGVADGTTVTMPTQTYASVTSVCIYATSTKDDGDVADRAPDEGCSTFTPDSGGGTQNFG